MDTILEVRRLYAGYANTEVLKNVDFKLNRGQILGIVGESGSGKSTILKVITQLESCNLNVTSGEVLFCGRNLTGLEDSELRHLRGSQMSFVSQNSTASLNPLRRIKHQFADTITSHEKVTKAEVLERSRLILRKLSFDNPDRILNAFPYELSGGMNQRVSIALATVLKPKLLLADEPTSALDVTVQAQVIKELLSLRDEFQTSICMITHNLGVAAYMADQIAVIQNGRIVEYGSKHEVIMHPKHEHTKCLLESIPKLGKPIKIQVA